MPREPVEARQAEDQVEGRLAGLHSVSQFGKGTIWLGIQHPDELARPVPDPQPFSNLGQAQRRPMVPRGTRPRRKAP